MRKWFLNVCYHEYIPSSSMVPSHPHAQWAALVEYKQGYVKTYFSQIEVEGLQHNVYIGEAVERKEKDDSTICTCDVVVDPVIATTIGSGSGMMKDTV
jgi:hypothetical protein